MKASAVPSSQRVDLAAEVAHFRDEGSDRVVGVQEGDGELAGRGGVAFERHPLHRAGVPFEGGGDAGRLLAGDFEVVGHDATVAAEALADEVEHARLRDTFGGYIWGDPVILCTLRPQLPVFTLEQWALAERLAVAS